ncbi:ATP-binding protein [Paenibacillus wynnii]|uniref:ATP-binding protein n=1 Tax=Paenibacillus wynnii TaxID=268407 RepID=UPI0027943A28|nr:ATP-binding protein [Paenibacillus wynnii]MDQ0195679.1 two-component system sensor histidine kinase ChiS [Paenibacillus wynnii]
MGKPKMYLFIAICFFAVILLDSSIYLLMYHQENSRPYVNLNKGFQYRFGDSAFNEQGEPSWTFEEQSKDWNRKTTDKLSAKERQGRNYVWMKIKLPEGDWEDPHLFLYRSLDIFEIYVDHQLFHQFGDWNNPDKLMAYPSHFISIPKEMMGKTIYFRIYSTYDPIGLSSTMLFGNGESIIFGLILADAHKYIISIIFMFLSMLSMLLYWKNRRERGFLYFSMFAMSASAIIITQQVQSKFIWNLPFFDYYLNIIAVFSIMFLFLQFIEYIYEGPYRKVICWLKRISLLIFIAVIIVSCINPKYLIQYKVYDIDSLFILLCFAIVMPILFHYLHKNNQKEQKVLYIGILLFTLICIKGRIAEFMWSFISIPSDLLPFGESLMTSSIEWALFCLVVTFGLIMLGRFQEVYEHNKIYLNKLKKQNEMLLQMNKMKDEFLARTSHELRTPLNGMVGISESLMDGVCGPVNKEISNNLAWIILSGKRLTKMVNDILDFTKLRYNEVLLQFKPVRMKDEIDLVISICKSLVGTKSLVFINEASSNLPLVKADDNRVQQILYNLIGNAIKFTESGCIQVNTRINGDWMEISVSDTGIGIQQDKWEVIFDPFQQEDESISYQFGGTGLGLSISKQLIELHGGSIGLTSKVGVGSIFTFTLPVYINDESVDEETQSEDAASTFVPLFKESIPYHSNQLEPYITTAPSHSTPEDNEIEKDLYILVVDDEMVNIQVLFNYLSFENYTVMHACSGMEALEILERGLEPDLILLDVMMPNMSGFQVIKEIRKTYAIHELPIILLTARDMEQDLVAGFNLGANDYLIKPFSKNELLSRIKMHIKLTGFNKIIEQTVRERTGAIKNLLDYAGQGFLSFNASLRVDEEFSAECTRIFDINIAGSDVTELLFPTDLEQRNKLEWLLQRLFSSGQSLEDMNPFIDLLPQETTLEDEVYRIDYRFYIREMKDRVRRCMIVLTNITEQQQLSRQLEHEQNALKIMTQVSSRPYLVVEIIDQYERILLEFQTLNEGSSDSMVKSLYKRIHSLKGNFTFLHMQRISAYLNEMESYCYQRIHSSIKQKNGYRSNAKSLKLLHMANEEFTWIQTMLGEWFAQKDKKSQPLHTLILGYKEYVMMLAERRGKIIQLLPLEETEITLDSTATQVLSEVLIHLLHNAIEHGIELPDERSRIGKNSIGTIKFKLEQSLKPGFLALCVQDDGRGMDTKAIRRLMVQRKITSEQQAHELSEEEIVDWIFTEGLTTSAAVTEFSGHGMGLAAAKDALISVGGSIRATFSTGQSSQLHIEIPCYADNLRNIS